MTQSMARALIAGGAPGPDGAPTEHPMLRTVTELVDQLKRSNAPKRVVRDAAGKAIGIEAVQ